MIIWSCYSNIISYWIWSGVSINLSVRLSITLNSWTDDCLHGEAYCSLKHMHTTGSIFYNVWRCPLYRDVTVQIAGRVHLFNPISEENCKTIKDLIPSHNSKGHLNLNQIMSIWLFYIFRLVFSWFSFRLPLFFYRAITEHLSTVSVLPP